jgi:hypothetical protein
MPYDPRIQEAVRQIAQERRVSLAEARRILVEHIDHLKRELLSTGSYGLGSKGVRVTPENPQRRHVHVELGDTRPSRSVKSHTGRIYESRNHRRLNRTPGRAPSPGTITSIIYGAITDPERDFNDAYVSLRAQDRFKHLSNKQLRQRMREVAWRYDLNVWYREPEPARVPDAGDVPPQ